MKTRKMGKYKLARSESFKEDYVSIVRKNAGLQKRLDKKILQILENPEVYKPLKKPLQGYKRVHVGPFVITYRIDGIIVRFVRVAHHDKIYGLFHD